MRGTRAGKTSVQQQLRRVNKNGIKSKKAENEKIRRAVDGGELKKKIKNKCPVSGPRDYFV